MSKTLARMCIVCHCMQPKKELMRVVKNKDNEIFIDTTLKANGRGAYICKNAECIAKCSKKKLLHKTFKQEIDEAVYQELRETYEHCKD